MTFISRNGIMNKFTEFGKEVKYIAIQIYAKSAIAILAVAALLTIVSGINLGNQDIIALGMNMFSKVLIGLIIMTILINLPKILRAI